MHIDEAFGNIKNKFVMPNSLSHMKATYVHTCERKSECECIALTSYLLHCLSSRREATMRDEDNSSKNNYTFNEEIE